MNVEQIDILRQAAEEYGLVFDLLRLCKKMADDGMDSLDADDAEFYHTAALAFEFAELDRAQDSPPCQAE